MQTTRSLALAKIVNRRQRLMFHVALWTLSQYLDWQKHRAGELPFCSFCSNVLVISNPNVFKQFETPRDESIESCHEPVQQTQNICMTFAQRRPSVFRSYPYENEENTRERISAIWSKHVNSRTPKAHSIIFGLITHCRKQSQHKAEVRSYKNPVGEMCSAEDFGARFPVSAVWRKWKCFFPTHL